MSEQNTVWRDIKADRPKPTYEDILCYEPYTYTSDGRKRSDARYYVTSGYALENQYKCGTEDEEPTHWQPLPPPPGEEVEDWYALGVKDGRDGCLVELDALQARCDKLEAERNQVIQELIEKIGPKASVYSYNRYGGGELEWDYSVAEWLKSQLEGENDPT